MLQQFYHFNVVQGIEKMGQRKLSNHFNWKLQCAKCVLSNVHPKLYETDDLGKASGKKYGIIWEFFPT